MPEEVTITGPELDKAKLLLEENHKLTMGRLFWKRVQEWGPKTAMREKVFGIWKDITWKDYGENAKHVGLALKALGLENEDSSQLIKVIEKMVGLEPIQSE